MSELKSCPVCDKYPQEFFGYDYGKVGCKNEDCNYSFRPQHPEEWNNRPYENKLKADAVREAAKQCRIDLRDDEENLFDGICDFDDLNEYAEKLERGNI